jgi:hypothetical protein
MNKYSSDEDIHSWLSLVTQHGLFVSDPVLNTYFSKGVDHVSAETFRAFKREFDLYGIYSEKDESAKFTRWINFILEDFLGFSKSSWCKHPNIQDNVKHYLFEYDQWLTPDRVLLSNDGKPLLIVKLVKNGKSLERPEKEKGKWKASPYFKLTTLCLEKNIPLALLTNGDEFRLIHVKPTTGTSYFEWKARDCYEEKSLLFSFYTFLNKDRFFGDENKRLLHLIDESQKRQLDVTDQLGGQMHHALEIFVRAIGNLKQSDLEELFSNATGEYIYEMSLTFMMRLVFLLYAEENGLLPHGNFVYENNYGISHLVYQIQSRIKDEQYMNKKDAWPRILALFRLIYSGCGHPDVKSIPYDSELFDPERFPELEHPSLVLDNKTIWNFLHNLCYAETKIGREKVKQKVSYHTIDVEQIGSVYESLIGFSVERAFEKMVVFKSGENTIRPVSEFINLDDDNLVDYLKSVTGRTEDSIRNILENNEESIEGLSRFERFIAEEGIIEKDQLYISRAGSIRKSSGTYYTPKEITRFLVQEALEPLVYEETEDGKKIKSPREILDLNICDPAMGSGAFLVQAIRYLSERLVESWTKINSDTDENITLPYGDISHGADYEELLPSDETEALQRAKLYVAQNCIYGVDKNPMAVELAKVSIWLTTMCKDRPLTFLDHRLKCGDSLIGTDFEHISKIPDEPLWKEDKKYNQAAAKSKTLTGINFEEFIKDILTLRENLKSPELTIDDIKRKSKQYIEAHTEDKPISKLKEVFNLWASVWFWPYNESDKHNSETIKNKTLETTLYSVNGDNKWVNHDNNSDTKNKDFEGSDILVDVISPPHTGKYREIVLNLLNLNDEFNTRCQIDNYKKIIKDSHNTHQFFHWELEFPELFLNQDGLKKDKRGFDAIIGNPPWDAIKMDNIDFFSQYYPMFKYLRGVKRLLKEKELLSNDVIYSAYQKRKRDIKNLSIYFKNSKSYLNLGIGDLNLFKLFYERNYNLSSTSGYVSLVLPSAIYSDSGCSDLRLMTFNDSRIKFIVTFENKNKIFPIAPQYKFALMCFNKGEKTDKIPSMFNKRDLDVLVRMRDNLLNINLDLVSLTSPKEMAIMEFENDTELKIITKLFEKYPLFGINLNNNWNISFSREVELSSGKDSTNILSEGYRILEGKTIYQYILKKDLIKLYIKKDLAKSYLSSKRNNDTYKDYRILIRRQSVPNINSRCLVSTLAPPNYLLADSLCYASVDNKDIRTKCYLVSVINSFIADFIMRKMMSRNITFSLLDRLPIPRLDNDNWFFNELMARSIRLIAIDDEFEYLWDVTYNNQFKNMYYEDNGTSKLKSWRDISSIWNSKSGVHGFSLENNDLGDRAHLRAEIDALMAHLYSITEEEFAYILETFPVQKKKEFAEFNEYQSKRMCLEEFERLKPIIEEERKKHPEQFEIKNYGEE